MLLYEECLNGGLLRNYEVCDLKVSIINEHMMIHVNQRSPEVKVMDIRFFKTIED